MSSTATLLNNAISALYKTTITTNTNVELVKNFFELVVQYKFLLETGNKLPCKFINTILMYLSANNGWDKIKDLNDKREKLEKGGPAFYVVMENIVHEVSKLLENEFRTIVHKQIEVLTQKYDLFLSSCLYACSVHIYTEAPTAGEISRVLNSDSNFFRTLVEILRKV